MNVLQIILTICVIGMFIFSIGLINLVLKRFRNISKKKSIKPSLIDQMLFYERSPFAWRIGFAYSLWATTKIRLMNLMMQSKKLFWLKRICIGYLEKTIWRDLKN